MSESLWGPEDTPTVKKFKPRKAQPMASVAPVTQPAPVVKPTFTAREAPRDYAMEDAVRVLAMSGVLHADELVAHQHLFKPSPGVQAEITEWRVRNGLDL